MHNLDGLGYKDKTVVVTGASSGLGQAAARILGELGARLYLVDIKKPSIPCERFYPTDLEQPDQVRATTTALQEIGPIDHIFACAGVAHTLGPVRCMQINYIGTRQFVEALLPAMKSGGSVGLVASDGGIAWQQNLASNLELLAIADPEKAHHWCETHPEAIRDGYSASKEMLIVWAKHSSIELGKQGIRINCIGPCPIATPFIDEASQGLETGYFDRFPYPLLGRLSTPEEQAWPLILLSCSLNAVVTGALLYTDQGFAGGICTGSLNFATS